ncbi:M15 family metallopeptidase [Demequina sp. SYSU T00039]|uniref:M15 family metallopeptidase n=1 Tax=Demequina lignilytica TaxID=3051663 RepID=A0AAW7M164_9MICO|nr:M15 family metallopeptidase [Demequina sp. SYSU T00039]MDN4486627.1 M15 family metallopeptidase [Demequina sp. SYSU T00039]
MFFTAGVTAGAVYDEDRVTRAVAHARAMADEVEASRVRLEGSLARAEAVAADAATVAASGEVVDASVALATSADAAARAAELHQVAVETPSLALELPVPLAVDGSATGASVLAGLHEPTATSSDSSSADEQTADAPVETEAAMAAGHDEADLDAPVVDDDAVVQVLSGDVASPDEAYAAAERLERAAADLESAAREIDDTADRLAEAAAGATLERDVATLAEAQAHAESLAADMSDDANLVAERVLDGAAVEAVLDAATALGSVAATEVDVEDPDAVARGRETLSDATRTLEDAYAVMEDSHAGWVSAENARRAEENAARRDTHERAVAAAVDERTARYLAAVAQHQAGWSGQPAGMSYANGRLPAAALCPLPFAASAQLSCDAATALIAADDAYHAETGGHLVVLSSYRSYAAQVSTRAARAGLAAAPGTSNHGWGMAVDLDAASSAWLRANGADFGWVHPTWARVGGSKPEAWHLEFVAPGVGQLEVEPLELLEPVDSLLDD